MKAKEIHDIIFDPQRTSKILHYFLSGGCNVNDIGLKFEFIYMVLPLVHNDECLRKLIRTNNKSTFIKFWKSKEIRNTHIPINKNIEAFKQETNNALIFLAHTTKIQITNFISIKEKSVYQDETNTSLKPYANAAYKLGMLLAKEDYRNVFIQTEITAI